MSKIYNETREDQTMVPPVDVFEDDNGITLYADMPGVSKEKLDVNVDADTLTIAGEVTLTMDPKLEARHVEVSVPRYRRSFTLGQELDRSRIAAELKNGVLKLVIPKSEKAKPRRIEVQAT
ncbi:MAG TPA: Hsp20/alpha crystallin family protein [Burkholderiaceae bacterium]|jgi:HSP20 family molecular chaperone IbpA